MRKLYRWMIPVGIVVLLLFACSKEDGNNEGGKNESPGASESGYYPFTGLKAEDAVDRRAVAVMVSNQVQARPQTSLSKADMVFEMLTEGNITRFMAIYQSTEPDVVGPVRSAREYFFTLADGYDALYIYSGAANFVNDMIKERDIDHLEGALYDNDGHLFVREPFRKAPHNMYLQFGAVDEVATEEGYDMTWDYEPMAFLDEGEAVPDEGELDGTYAKIDYYGSEPIVEFEYDEANETYTRIDDGETTVELESEKPIEMNNVLIVEADHQVIDDENRRAIDTESGGQAVLLRQGTATELEWENRDGRIVPVKDGEVEPFVPGQTWVIFIQATPESGVTEQLKIGKE